MIITRRTHRLPTLILGCLTAALLAPRLMADAPPVTINYTDGQTDAMVYDTSGAGGLLSLSITSGTATQSGVLTGSGSVIKADAGTLILTAANDYSGSTFLDGGTLQVVASGVISHGSSDLTIGNQSGDVATLLISGGSVTDSTGFLGYASGSSGTVNVTGGTWTNNDDLSIGTNGTGVLNLSNGFVSNNTTYLGDNVGGSGTANVSGGTWQSSGGFYVGSSGTGVLNLSGGVLQTGYATVGNSGGGTANVSGGTWAADGLILGYDGPGVMNLTGGVVTVESGGVGTVYLGYNSGSGVLNIGTGGAAGQLQAASVRGNTSGVVNFNHTGSLTFTPALDGNLSVTLTGPGTTTFTTQNSYTGPTSVLGGTLQLQFGKGTVSDILSEITDLSLGSGTLLMTGSTKASQAVNSFSLSGGAASIVLASQGQFLDLGNFDSVARGAAVNFNTAAGGADGDNPGNSVIALHGVGSAAGAIIDSAFTVTDATGFGLATVNDKDLVVRLTSVPLLPASGADSGTDYHIDNNPGAPTDAGSSSLIVTDPQSAGSITVDTTAAVGVLTLADNAVLTAPVWNFGSAAGLSHAFTITGGANSGITTDYKGGFVQINNYNAAPVTIATSILETDVTGLQVGGTGTTVLTATSNYTGNTVVTGGVLEVATNGSINNDPSLTLIGSQPGDNGHLLVSGGSITDGGAMLGDSYGATGTATVSAGTWNADGILAIGNDGTGVLNISGGMVQDTIVYAGAHSSGRGTVNVSGGQWSVDTDLLIGGDGTAALNLSGGSVVSRSGTVGNAASANGTVNVSGGAWDINGDLAVGDAGTGVLNISGGSVSNTNAVLGQLAGSSGTANVSGGSWQTSGGLFIGNDGTGVLNISGGSVSSNSAIVGNGAGSSGTVNVSGGTLELTSLSPLVVGLNGSGVFNLTGSGTVTVGNNGFGTLVLAGTSISSGTLNIGTGGVTGNLYAARVSGGDGTAVVNFNHTGPYVFTPVMSGSLTVNQIGPGTTTLSTQSTYTGATHVLAGTLELNLGVGSSNILPATTDLTLGSATLLISSFGSQTVNSLSLVADTAGSIVLGSSGQTLDLGSLGSVGSHSALNFNTAAGGASGSSTGSSVVLLAGQTPGSVINPSFTVADFTGFGLATVNNLGDVIRLTDTALLPAKDAVVGTDYLINNNSDGSAAAGSSSLIVIASQTARSITVDTTATAGLLSIASGAVLSSDVWNFGSSHAFGILNIGGGFSNNHAFEITANGPAAGIATATAGGTLQFNNFNDSPITLSASIFDNGGSSALFQGPGTTILAGSTSYGGNTTVSNGVLQVAATGAINATLSTTVGKQLGDHAVLNILGTVSDFGAVIGDAAGAFGTVNVSQGGGWANLRADLTVGNSGTGVLIVTDDNSVVASDYGYIGYNAGSSGTVTLSNGGSWDANYDLYNGYSGTGVLNIDGGYATSGGGYIGYNAGSSGTVTVSNEGGWSLDGNLYVGNSGTGVLNINESLVESTRGYIGVNAGSSGTVTINNGEWDISNNLFIGQDGTGVLSLTNGGMLGMQRKGIVTLGALGTLNFGTGGVSGSLNAQTVTGVSGAVVNFNYFDLGRFKPPFSPILTGDLAVNKLGSGTLFFRSPNTYTGGTTVNGGKLELDFGPVTNTNLISSASALTLGGGTLDLSAESKFISTQTFNGLTTTAGTGSQIILSPNVTLDLGALTSAGQGSALNFDTYDGKADGATVGTAIVLLSGQTAGSVINPGFTVTDFGGFGLATVNSDDQIIRLTNTDLLPDHGAVADTDYLIDNHKGLNLDAGSSGLEITFSQTARSITVDSTFARGRLTLDSGAVLRSDVWNFGGTEDYKINTCAPDAGITTATAGGMLQINNFNYDGVVTLSAPILDNGGSGLRVAGPDGLTVLTGTDTYKGETLINSGTLFINGDHSAATGEIIVQSSAELAGTGQIGGNIHVLNGGMVTPGNIKDDGTLFGITATFDAGSVFHVISDSSTLGSLHLTGAVTIAPGALIYLDSSINPTQSKYILMTAASGLDGSIPFTVENNLGPVKSIAAPAKTKGDDVIPGYHLAYTGTELDLVADIKVPAVAYWTGKVDDKWSSLSSGSSNWATAADGLTDTAALPDSPTDVTFSAQTVPLNKIVNTFLDVDLTINSLTINTPTSIIGTEIILGPGAPPPTSHTLTVTTTTTINSLLNIEEGVTLIDNGTLTIAKEGNLAGNVVVQMAADQSMIVNGSINGPVILSFSPPGQSLSLTTSGTGAVIMEAGSFLHINLNTGAGLGDNTAVSSAAGTLNLHGTLDATAGGTLVLENANAMTGYAGGDQWKVIDLNSGAGTITGHLALNDSSLGLATGFVGTFDQTTGIYTIADHRPEMTTQSSGLPMANAENQSIISGVQTSTGDVNNHLFNLRSGGGEEDGPDGSIASSVDDGVVVGQGDGPEDPIARRIKRTRQWEVFTTVNYGNVRLNPISNQSGVQVDSWASSVGIERHLSRGLTLGFAVTFLQSHQTYTGGLGHLDLEGPTLSAYVSYVKKAFWSSLLYSFGDYDLGSQRNPGLGLPTAAGATNAYTNAIQYNTGWNFRFLNNTLVTGPFAGIDYLHGTVDSYTETGGGAGALSYGKQTFQSLVTRIGWSASKKIETDWATITPQLRLSYERQNVRNNGTSVNLLNAPFSATGGNQTPGQDYMVIGTGVNFQFSPEFNMLLGYQTQIFRNNMTAHFGSIRFGYKF